MSVKKFVDRARQMGAKEAKIISSGTIVAADWVRRKCQFGCRWYGQRFACPPHTPSPTETKNILAEYREAVLIQAADSADIRRIVADLEREIFLSGYHKAWGMGAGPCKLCSECSAPCRYPEKARPAMEACGIDVFSTARNNGFPIEVVHAESDEKHFYGVVLID